MRNIIYIILAAFIVSLNGCGPHVKTIWLTPQDTLKNKYVSFSQPANEWYLLGDKLWNTRGSRQWLRLYSSPKGVIYDLEVKAVPFESLPWKELFDKNAKYDLVLTNEDMQIDENDKEQGIGYSRLWISYAQGLKCYEGVFSRSQGGIMKGIRNKNYSLTCGYYDKIEGKRLLGVSYKYNYAGGNIRHQKDADVPQSDLMSLADAELRLKLAVKQLLSTIQIKNLDRNRMEREGLMHYDKEYEISPY